MSRGLILVLLIALLASLVACTPAEEIPEGDAAMLQQEGKAALDSGDVDGALTKLQRAAQIDQQSAETHFLLGNAYARKDQYAQAEQAYLQALRLDPSYTDARSNLGVVYYRQGKLQDAEKAFREALGQSPNDADIHYNLGGVLASLNQLDAALSEFNSARELDPSLAEPYLGIGTVYKLQGRRQEAISALREYLSRTSDPTWRAQAEQLLRELE
jgi:Flp pilus assembly protein TadD